MEPIEARPLTSPDQIQTPHQLGRSRIGLIALQILAGISLGFVSDYFLNQLSFDLLIKFKLIVLIDDFDSIYSNRGLQDTLSWGVFASLLLGFFYLTDVTQAVGPVG